MDATSPSHYRLNVADVAAQFSLQYYNAMSCQPEGLHAFYGKQSHLVHSVEEDLEAPICSTLDSIHSRLVEMNYQGARIVVESIDAQPSMNGGIFVQTTGNMRMKTGGFRNFVQSFFLAEQPNGYFVLNDVLRFKENSQSNSKAAQSQEIKSAGKVQTQQQKQPEVETPAPKVEEAKPVPPKPEVKETPKPLIEKAVQKPNTKSAPSNNNTHQPKAAAIEPEATANPGSWASLAAGRADLWKDGVVAPTKAPVVVNVPTEKSNQQTKTFTSSAKTREGAKPRQTRDTQKTPFVPKVTQDYSRSVFIRNLGTDINADELRQVLEAVGKITSFDVNVVKSQAFVEYETAELASLAISSKITFRGSLIQIDARRPPVPRHHHHHSKPRNTRE